MHNYRKILSCDEDTVGLEETLSTDFLGTKAVIFENELPRLNSGTSALSFSVPW